MKVTKNQILLGSTFPLSLIRRRVTIEPAALEDLRQALKNRGFVSFWGHTNTQKVASEILGADITPASGRPVLQLNEEALPFLNGQGFNECWVLSPDYQPGFRPQLGEEVVSEKITGWQVLKISWE